MKNLSETTNLDFSLQEKQSAEYFISDKSLLIEDSEDTGLERIIVDRNSFFRGEEIV